MLRFFPQKQTPPPEETPAPPPVAPPVPAATPVAPVVVQPSAPIPAPPSTPQAAPAVPTASAPARAATFAPEPNLTSSQPKPPAPMADSLTKNILSKDVEIKGSIKFTNELIIDGKIEGEIISDGNLTVGENADIKGEIKTKSVTVLGKIQGNITVQERCELKTRAHLIGDLRAARVIIEEGATFVGKSEVTSGGGAAKPAGSSAPKAESSAAPSGGSSSGSSDASKSGGGATFGR